MAASCSAARAHVRGDWRAPRRCATASGAAAPKKPPSTTYTTSNPLTLVINLERRPDRIVALKKLALPFEWDRMDATDGRTLSWEALGSGGSAEHVGVVQPDAVREAMWAETRKMPTICRRHSKKRAVDGSKYLTWFCTLNSRKIISA